jgi:protein-S-isoprenylcysteine O-methyltransferase Ste14
VGESRRSTRAGVGLGKLLFAAVAYLLALLPMVYFVGFLANVALPKTIDSGVAGPIGSALAIDLLLIGSFAVVHSLLARPGARRRVASRVGADLERPLYSAIAGLQFVLLLWAWEPLPQLLWTVSHPAARVALWALYAFGWALVLAGVGTLGTARLYGLSAIWARFRGRGEPEERIELRGPYRFVRHPLYTGTILALWAAPDMSAGRALLAGLFTAYTLIGQRLEDRDLLARHGDSFADYRRSVGAYLPKVRIRGEDH